LAVERLKGGENVQKEVKVRVDLRRGIATVQLRYNLFDNPSKRFIIDYDAGGFSCIEKRGNEFHHVSYLKGAKKLSDKEITRREAKKIIKEVLESLNA